MSYEYIAAGLLLLAGIYYFFFLKTQAPQEVIVSPDASKGKDNQEENKESTSRQVIVSKGDVSQHKIPSNFPQRIDIYFGSQTGNSEKFSHVLEEECEDLGVEWKVIDMEDYDKDELANAELALFIVSTHGEGDPTDNALRMHTWIKKAAKNNENTLLKKLKFSVFGVGDTEYENFWAVGKFFDKKLEELGATRIFNAFFGDTSGDLEGEFTEWKAKLWPTLISHYESLNTSHKTREKAPHHKNLYPLKMVKPGDKNEEHQIQPLWIRQYIHGKDVKIHSIRECRQTNKYGSCLEIIYSLKDEQSGDLLFQYQTAENLAVFPENDQLDVDRVWQRLGFDKNFRFIFVNEDEDKELRKHPFPTPCTIGEALTKYWDLKGHLDRNIFKHICEFASDESEKKELQRLSTNEAKGDIELMKKNYANLLDILDQFKSIHISEDVFFQFVPKMMPRYYTIASSSKLSPDKVRIAISLTNYESENGKKFIGLTSDYFDRIFKQHYKEESKESITSRIFFKDSLFRLPESPKTPLIMIGPGTGVVPFIAFAEEREYWKTHNISAELGEAHLYFGCKGQNDDYIYKDEIANFKTNGTITHLYEAFSRDQDKKVYVQDLMKEHWETLKDLIINQNAYVYIWGSMSMGHAVEKLLEETIVADPDKWKEIKDQKKFAKELWTA